MFFPNKEAEIIYIYKLMFIAPLSVVVLIQVLSQGFYYNFTILTLCIIIISYYSKGINSFAILRI